MEDKDKYGYPVISIPMLTLTTKKRKNAKHVILGILSSLWVSYLFIKKTNQKRSKHNAQAWTCWISFIL